MPHNSSLGPETMSQLSFPDASLTGSPISSLHDQPIDDAMPTPVATPKSSSPAIGNSPALDRSRSPKGSPEIPATWIAPPTMPLTTGENPVSPNHAQPLPTTPNASVHIPADDMSRSRSPSKLKVRIDETPEVHPIRKADDLSISISPTRKKLKADSPISPRDPGARGSADFGPNLPLLDDTSPLHDDHSTNNVPSDNDDDEYVDDDATVDYPSQEREDSTISYEDDLPDDVNELNYLDHRLHHATLAAERQIKAQTVESQLYHAIADAERVLHDYEQNEAGYQPWTSAEAMFVWPTVGKSEQCFYVGLIDQEIFSVTSDDILTPEDIIKHWDLIDAADREEIRSFVKHKVFHLQPLHNFNANNIVDAIWVRRWKDRSKLIIKCRLCGRGYLDKQKLAIDRHSSTASRLSHRLAISQSIIYELDVESIDISTAFLQGLNFSEITARAKELGLEVKAMRKVWLKPPANVWRHLRAISESNIKVQDGDTALFVLELLKAMYGLVDGPLLFQLALLHFLCTQLKLTRSIHDDNYLYLSNNLTMVAIFVVHVDDVLLCAKPEFLRHSMTQIEKRFGKLKHHRMPFTYIGIVHQRLSAHHIFLHQEPYLMKLRIIDIASSRKKDKTSPLTAVEHKQFRSLLCSVLWLCLTRQDLVADVVQLQQDMVKPTVQNICELNALLKRAVNDKIMNGLHFGKLTPPLRVVGIGDAGQASKRSLYAQEGKLVLLMSDVNTPDCTQEWLSATQATNLGGMGHPLFHSGKKATRVSHSTSHAEALSAIGTTQVAQLISNRMSEPFAATILNKLTISARDLMIIQLNGYVQVPVDHVTDCMDLYELVCGVRGLSADKNQRLIITSLREDRAKSLIRRFQHWPTSIMLADGLTKGGFFQQLSEFVTTGKLSIRLAHDKWIRTRTWKNNGSEPSASELPPEGCQAGSE